MRRNEKQRLVTAYAFEMLDQNKRDEVLSLIRLDPEMSKLYDLRRAEYEFKKELIPDTQLSPGGRKRLESALSKANQDILAKESSLALRNIYKNLTKTIFEI